MTITKSGLTKSEETGSTDGKTVVKDFNSQPMFILRTMDQGMGSILFVPVPANQAAPVSGQFCQRHRSFGSNSRVCWARGGLHVLLQSEKQEPVQPD